MYVRVTRTVQDKGVLVRPKDVDSVVSEHTVDWYRSAFVYGEDAKEYWEDHGNSIQGYKGEAFTQSLYWDIDCENDFDKARKATITLYDKLKSLGLDKGIEIYFSGNKGFHLLLFTKNKFTPSDTATICQNVVVEAGVPSEVFDTSVYNVTRIFRIVNTRHQKSKLYKIPVSYDELTDLSEEEIKDLAAKQRQEEISTEEVDGAIFQSRYLTKVKKKTNNLIDLKLVATPTEVTASTELDLKLCPPGHRKCIYTLEQGYFGPSERHEALLRLSAYYRGQGFSRKHAGDLIFEALERRTQVYIDINPTDELECNRDIDEVFSDEWKGGTYTCKTDHYLAGKCDQGEGPCYNDAKVKIRNVWNADQLINNYIKYGEEALVDYPKFGLSWLDERIRLRPKNYSMIAGANGSGKTSLVIQLMENLNRQKIYHVFFSLDMSDSAIMEKLGSKYTRYSQKDIERAFNVNSFNKEIVEEVKTAIKENIPYTLIDFTSSVTMPYIEQTVMALKQVYDNLQMVIVDYCGRLIGDHDNQYANATANANLANDVAKRTRCHLLMLSQVSRENGDHTDSLRSSRVSKDSGAWEENATVVLTVWRPFGNGIDGRDEFMHIYIGKNRSGPLGENVFRWEGKTGTISEMDSDKEFNDYVQLCEQNQMEVPKFNWFAKEIEPIDNPRFNKKKTSGINYASGKAEEQDVQEDIPNDRSPRSTETSRAIQRPGKS